MSRPSHSAVLAFAPALLSLCLAGGAAGAQPAFELEPLELNPGGRGGTRLNGAALLPQGQFSASLIAVYDYEPVIFALKDAGYAAPVVDRLVAHLVVAFAPLRWLQVSTQVPLLITRRTVDLGVEGASAGPSAGLGSVQVATRLGVASEDDGQALDFAVELGVRLPSVVDPSPGHAQPLGFAPRLSVAKRAGTLRLEASAAAVLQPGAADRGFATSVDVALAGVHSRGGVGQEVDIAVHVPVTGGPPSFELLTGARYAPSDQFSVFLLLGPGLGLTPTFSFRVLAGLTFGTPTFTAPKRRAREGPASSAPAPTGTAFEQAMGDADARPPDSDLDGLPDSQDACPLEAGPADLRGCADRDSDGDGRLDSLDRCPNTPGLARWLGCPMPDRDRDTVPDDEDLCPVHPGPADAKGCPPLDSDQDGLADDLDACPSMPGPAERQGCPGQDADGGS